MAQKPEPRAAAGVGSRGPFPLSRSVHDGWGAGPQSQRASSPQQDTCEHSEEPESAREGAAAFSTAFFFFFFHFLFLKKHT